MLFILLCVVGGFFFFLNSKLEQCQSCLGRECFGFWNDGRRVLSKFLMISRKFKQVVLQLLFLSFINRLLCFFHMDLQI